MARGGRAVSEGTKAAAAISRRGMLLQAGLGTAGLAVAAAVAAKPAAATVPVPAPPAKAGYRESAHVRRVYDLARF